MDMDYDLMISELYQTQHECYMLAMALNNVVELVPVYEHPLQPSGAGEALLIQQVTDALVNACHTMMYTVNRIHEMLMAVSGDMTRVFHTVELARTRLETGIANARKNGNTRNGTPVVIEPVH